MKRLSLILIVMLLLSITSCGRSGWSCKNRYGKATQNNEIKKTFPTQQAENVKLMSKKSF